MDFTIIYTDGHSTKVAIFFDKKLNSYRYINLSQKHICKCIFPSIKEALKDLKKYDEILAIRYEGTWYGINDFIEYFG
jgi:hypothetical protein